MLHLGEQDEEKVLDVTTWLEWGSRLAILVQSGTSPLSWHPMRLHLLPPPPKPAMLLD